MAKKKQRLLIDQYPTRYMPHVGRQVMADGGVPDDVVNQALAMMPQQQAATSLARSVLSEPRSEIAQRPVAPRARPQKEEKSPVKTSEGRQLAPVKYQSWDDVPTINPQDLVGKRIFPIFADLTKAGSPYEGIDAAKLAQPEPMYGGPGYPLLPESQQHGLAWAVEGKGRGSSKIRKDADYVVVHAMEQDTHKSNASFANSLIKTMESYANTGRLKPEALQELNDMVRTPSEQKELKHLEAFPGFEHPEAADFIANKSTFEGRKRIADILQSAKAQSLGAPNIEKVVRSTLDPEFAGVPSRHGMFLMEIPKGTEDEQLVHLASEGLPIHPSYQYGIKGKIVGKFHNPVAPETLFKDWFDEANAKAQEKIAAGEKPNVRRAFDLAMPVTTISQEVADLLPRHPRDIQSGKAAKLALNAFNDQWGSTEAPVNQGGLSPADLSRALQSSDASSTLSQYSQKELRDMIKEGKFTGYKLKDGEIYFGLKRGTNYAEEYGFSHPDLTDNETALVSVVNNEPGAKGIGGAPVVLKAIQHGATALDAYAVPSKKHPNGFLPDFYSHFGFEELGRIPFDPKYVSPQQFEDMKHEWTKAGWDENIGMPEIVIMKWKGNEDDRSDAVRRFIQKSGEDHRAGASRSNVRRPAGSVQQGAGSASGAPQGGREVSDIGGDRGPVGAGNAPRPADRLTRTLREIRGLPAHELPNFGLSPEDVEAFKANPLSNFAEGGIVENETKE
jgi:hypothetical protein